MKMPLISKSVVTAALFFAGLASMPELSDATSLKGAGPSSERKSDSSPRAAAPTKKEIVTQYIHDCRTKPSKEGHCDKLRKDAVEILKEDLHTLGSSANRSYMPVLVDIFKSEEPELRITAADAIGMIGPQDQDIDLLAPLTNDPVPDVRRAGSQMILRGKGNAFSLLGQRTISSKMGLTPDTPPDAAKFAMPVAPDSTYLFDSGDTSIGRLSYVAKGKNDPAQFFKAKTKKGPYKWEEFRQQYRYQLKDEEDAMDQAQRVATKQFEQEKPPDPTNVQDFTEYMKKLQSVSLAGQSGRAYLDSYQPNLYGTPTVYVLEERQIGQRSYPTRYVVLYQDQAFRKPGYRLSWMTVSDDAIKVAQVASFAEEKEELARKKEDEALKKRQEALDNLTKKKDEQEKSKFKKGQADLEKELGF